MAPVLTIDWAKSPRIILVDNPDEEIIQQDLIDDLRTQESDINNADKDALVDGDGKQVLDTAGTLVGITNTLQDALLGFEADTTAKSQGTATTVDPLGKTLKDIGATFQADGVLPGAVIINLDDYSVASVIEVISETEILHLPLADGTLNTWVIGNNYKIWNIKQGIISGGNLVSVDTIGDPVATPIYPTPFTQVILSSSSSATLQELEAIQQNVYGQKVTLSNTNPKRMSGIDYPAGTHEYPSDNLADAKLIAAERGFEKFHFDSNWTLVSGNDVSGFTLEGNESGTLIITVESGAITNNTCWKSMVLTGILNGTGIIRDCSVYDLTDIKGKLEKCLLKGNLGFVGTSAEVVHVIDCKSAVPGSGTPDFDMGGDGPGLGVRGQIGGVRIKNKTGLSSISLDILSGQAIVDITVTNFTDFVIRGVAKYTNYSSTTPDVSNLVNPFTVSDQVWDELLTGINHNIKNSAGKRLRDLGTWVVHTGTARGPGTGYNQIQLDLAASTMDGAYDPSMVSIIDGTGSGQTRLVYQYDGTTRTATIDRNWKELPDDTSEFLIMSHPGREHVNEGLARGGTSNTIILNELACSIDGQYVNQLVFVKSGTGEDQVRIVTAYEGATRKATVERDWNTNPDTTSGYVILPAHVHTLTGITDAVWDDSTAKLLLGLAGKNQRIFPVSFDAFGNMDVGFMRIYDTKADADADENHIAQIELTGEFDGINKPKTDVGLKQVLAP